MHATLDTLRGLWIAGGDVTLPLVIVAALLWWTLGERWFRTRGAPKLPLRQLVHRAQRGEAVPGDGPIQRALRLGVASLAIGHDALEETLTQHFGALRDALASLSRRDLSLAFLDLGFEIRHRALLSRINPNSHKNVTKNYIPAPGNFRCTPALPQGTISPCPMPPFLPQSKRAAKT